MPARKTAHAINVEEGQQRLHQFWDNGGATRQSWEAQFLARGIIEDGRWPSRDAVARAQGAANALHYSVGNGIPLPFAMTDEALELWKKKDLRQKHSIMKYTVQYLAATQRQLKAKVGDLDPSGLVDQILASEGSLRDSLRALFGGPWDTAVGKYRDLEEKLQDSEARRQFAEAKIQAADAKRQELVEKNQNSAAKIQDMGAKLTEGRQKLKHEQGLRKLDTIINQIARAEQDHVLYQTKQSDAQAARALEERCSFFFKEHQRALVAKRTLQDEIKALKAQHIRDLESRDAEHQRQLESERTSHQSNMQSRDDAHRSELESRDAEHRMQLNSAVTAHRLDVEGLKSRQQNELNSRDSGKRLRKMRDEVAAFKVELAVAHSNVAIVVKQRNKTRDRVIQLEKLRDIYERRFDALETRDAGLLAQTETEFDELFEAWVE